jgi:hypothetical protein
MTGNRSTDRGHGLGESCGGQVKEMKLTFSLPAPSFIYHFTSFTSLTSFTSFTSFTSITHAPDFALRDRVE